MKKIFYLAVLLGFVTSIAFAADMPTTKAVTLKGYVIDNMCATSNKEKLGEFVKTHTKTCMLKASCLTSGYSIYSDGKLSKFNKESNSKIQEFLKKEDSKSEVEISAESVGDELNLISIKNQS